MSVDSYLAPYSSAIISLKDKHLGTDLTSKPRELLIMAHKYSSVKTPTARIKIDDKLITRNNAIVVDYKCLRCNVINTITLNLFIRKVNKHITGCDSCKNQDPDKRYAQSTFMKGERIVDHPVKWSELTLQERINKSLEEFELEDDEFKAQYFLRHLSSDEFDKVKEKIISIGNGKLSSLSGWEYISTFRVHNQMKYTPMLVNLEKNASEKPNYIKWSCECCSSQFVNRDIEVQKNRIKILCTECSFTNRTFKIRTMDTPWGKIRYQGTLESRFIQWCVENNIKITNGPRIEYIWNSRPHKYRVDFNLPDKNMLVEMKDNHIWHKMQIENGKWGAKESTTYKWCEENSMEYAIIFPKTLASWKEKLLSK
jgi:hypothetical protein